jgi:hypothetical protein
LIARGLDVVSVQTQPGHRLPGNHPQCLCASVPQRGALGAYPGCGKSIAPEPV